MNIWPEGASSGRQRERERAREREREREREGERTRERKQVRERERARARVLAARVTNFYPAAYTQARAGMMECWTVGGGVSA